MKKRFWSKLTGLSSDNDDEEKQDSKKQEKKESEVEISETRDFFEQELEKEIIQEKESEGELLVDVYQTEEEVIIKSAVAGVSPKDLDIIIDENIVTIKGRRIQEEEISEKDYILRECYWGDFSRTITLPFEIIPDKAKAIFKNGILIIKIPKKKKIKKLKIEVKENE